MRCRTRAALACLSRRTSPFRFFHQLARASGALRAGRILDAALRDVHTAAAAALLEMCVMVEPEALRIRQPLDVEARQIRRRDYRVRSHHAAVARNESAMRR